MPAVDQAPRAPTAPVRRRPSGDEQRRHGGQRGERGGDGERRPERPGDGVGHGVHQLVAGAGHRVVALGAALVELGGEIGHLPARRLLDRVAQRPRHRQLVAQRQFGRRASSASRRASPARCRPRGSTTAPARSAPGRARARRGGRRSTRRSARIAGPSAGTAAPSSTSCNEVEPGTAHGEGDGGHDRRRARAPAPARRARVPAAAPPPTATSGRGAAGTSRPTSMPSGSALTSSGALHRAVAPHLDGQQHAEEQRGDERGEHEGEADVGDDDVAAGACRARRAAGPRGAAPGPPGRRRRRSAAATIGAWTKKIARQANSSVSTPPSAGPMATPTAPASAHHRRARPSPANDRDEHGQRAGEQQRGADALDGAGGEQHGQARRGAGDERRRGEHGDAGDDQRQRPDPAVERARPARP